MQDSEAMGDRCVHSQYSQGHAAPLAMNGDVRAGLHLRVIDVHIGLTGSFLAVRYIDGAFMCC